jgi:hypothetical protein
MALARAPLQPRTIPYRNAGKLLAHEASLLQPLDTLAHARPSHPKVSGDGGMADANLVLTQQVLSQQQPALDPVLNIMMRVAQRHLSVVDHAHLHIAQRQSTERGICAEEHLGIRGLQPISLARGLDDDAQGGSPGSEHERQAGHPEATEEPYAVGAISVRPRLHGSKPVLDEVDVRDVRTGLLQHLPPSQRHKFQKWLDLRPVSRRECSQNQVAKGSQDLLHPYCALNIYAL